MKPVSAKIVQHKRAPLYLAVGALAEDHFANGEVHLGGTVYFSSRAAARLGWKPLIVTPVAQATDLPDEPSNAEWFPLPSPGTLAFDVFDANGVRMERIIRPCSAVTMQSMPGLVRTPEIVHLAPVAREVEPDIFVSFPNALRVATAQGWLRRWGEDGILRPDDLYRAEFLLSQLDIMVISEEDIAGDWQVAEVWAQSIPLLVVTQGAAGCTVYIKGKREFFAAENRQALNTIGAGDVFAAAFFIRFHETRDPFAAAHFANLYASLFVSRKRQASLPSRWEAETYLRGKVRSASSNETALQPL